MSKYKHVMLVRPEDLDRLSYEQYVNINKILDPVGDAGYRMIDYYEMRELTVLVFIQQDLTEAGGEA